MNILKLIENMAYKNFILRFIFSVIFIFIYLTFTLINFNFVFYLITIIYFFILIEIIIYFTYFRLLPLIYLLISYLFFVGINFNHDALLNFNFFILIVIIFDIFCYVIGKALGKKKLTDISPNKTYEGLIGGTLISFLISLLYAYTFQFKIDLGLILFIFLIIITSFFGDIIESYFKRKNKLKNSSKLIPGHGGVFDRFDSFLFSIIFYTVSHNYFI